jgi:putative hemolysin
MVLKSFGGSTPAVDVRHGDLQVRLALNRAEIEEAQALRYCIFYEDLAATPSPEVAAAKRDFDSFDDYCDHLVVLDHGGGTPRVVATYRVMRRAAAAARGRYYSDDEYDVSCLLALDGEILELGRSCIDPAHRSGVVMQLLWRGIGEYVLSTDIKVMFGCASLHGTDPREHALPLSYLYHHHLAPLPLRPRALAARYVDMNLMPADRIPLAEARKALPPLIKGYLRLGGFIGDGAVVDADFGTTDVCVVVKTDLVTGRYYRHYARGHEEKAGAGPAAI